VILFKLFTRTAERRESLFQIAGQKGFSKEVGCSVSVVHRRGLGPQLSPIFQGTIASAEPGQGDEIDLFVFAHGFDKRHELLIDRIISSILQHLGHAVVGRIGSIVIVKARVGVLDVEFTRFQNNKAYLFRRNRQRRKAARDISALGSTIVLGIILVAVVGYLLLTRRQAAAWLMLGAVLGGVALNNLLKFSFARPRPDLVVPVVRVFTSSFPSGHATLSAITYLTLGALLARIHSEIRSRSIS
jgi:PAP2 superfamily protein